MVARGQGLAEQAHGAVALEEVDGRDEAGEVRLQRPVIGTGDGAPRDRIEEGVERTGHVEFREGRELRFFEADYARLQFPDDREFLAKAFVFNRGQPHQVLACSVVLNRGREGQRGRVDVADHERALAHDDDLARFWRR